MLPVHGKALIVQSCTCSDFYKVTCTATTCVYILGTVDIWAKQSCRRLSWRRPCYFGLCNLSLQRIQHQRVRYENCKRQWSAILLNSPIYLNHQWWDLLKTFRYAEKVSACTLMVKRTPFWLFITVRALKVDKICSVKLLNQYAKYTVHWYKYFWQQSYYTASISF